MNAFQNIENKLHQFTRKYYTNELIKGIIMFFSLGAIYFFFILFIEYFLWLNIRARTILFILFVFVEIYLLIKFIVLPLFKLTGFRKGISFEESSKIIGNHFPEVKDKLINILQLKHESNNNSDLILASINQKSLELKPVPFVKAIDFKENTKYIKYLIIPIFIYLISLFTLSKESLKNSFQRVVDYNTAYKQPAPFYFSLSNKSLSVIQGESITVLIDVVGKSIPEEVKINYDNQEYYLQNNSNASFSYTFSNVQNDVNFFIESNGIQSEAYQLNIIKTPTISNVSIFLDYPYYTKRKDEFLENAIDTEVPEGTKIKWKVKTKESNTVSFINKGVRENFSIINSAIFEFDKVIYNSLFYEITSSNKQLQDFEKLRFSIDVIKDESPLINLTSNIDSITRGNAQFAGQISDDYGLTKLQLIYYKEGLSELKQIVYLDISKEPIQNFFYEFPNNLNLEEGVNYELFFKVFDNDAINGSKYSSSKIFKYRQKTEEEIKEELLQEQRNTIQSLENSLQKQKEDQKQLKKLQEDIQNKKNLNWNDKKKVDEFLKRQEQYKKMMQRQTDKLQENFEENEEKNTSLEEKQQQLKKRIEELKNLEKQQKLLEEIQKMADKLNKDDLVKKAKELAQQNKQQQRSLEKTLEMVKRFYVEQKTMQIANKIEELSKKQAQLQKKEETPLEKQNDIQKQFDTIKKELEELSNDNEKLKEPMSLPDVDEEKQDIDNELDKAKENIEKQNQQQAKKNQKESSNKMKKMSSKMQQSMLDMQGESMEENMDDLRKILENLVIFSFQQESLMNSFSTISASHPDFGNELKKQNQIKTYFEHIDDSLYVLSMRVPKISTKIQDDLSKVHYNLNQSLDNFSEARFDNGLSNQRYVITSANNLADYLSDILNNMMNNSSMKMGKGKKGKGNGFSLPDLIKKQEGLSKKMKEGLQKGNQKGTKKGEGKKGNKPNSDKKGEGSNGKNKGQGQGGSNDTLNEELYNIFKEQSLLRQELQNAINNDAKESIGNSSAKKALKTMEQLETEILEKGFSPETLNKMQTLNYELLKLDKAKLEQGKDLKRKSSTNKNNFKRQSAKALNFKKQFYNQIEILNRQSLPLQQNYKIKVRSYFSEIKNQ